VTHDQEEAIALGDKLGILLDGMIAQVGTPEEVFSVPKDIRIAEFLGMSNLIEGVVKSIDPYIVATREGDFTVGRSVRTEAPPGEDVTLLLKPINSQIAQNDQTENVLTGSVKEVEFRGQFYKIQISTPQNKLFELMLPEPLIPGSMVRLFIPESGIISY
jgi:ABC-type Fe3+/spermidine/putrescine transport system ATPase subunit